MTNQIAQLQAGTDVVDAEGRLKRQTRFFEWQRALTETQILSGSGSPEGVVEATAGRLYFDTAGTAGNILYVKRDAESGGDSKSGWILV